MRALWLLAVAGCGRIDFAPSRPDADGAAGRCNAITRFADDFEDGADVGGMWVGAYADPGTSATEAGGNLVLTLAPNSPGPTYVGYTATRFYDLREHRITFEVSQIANGNAVTAAGIVFGPTTHVRIGTQRGMIIVAQLIENGYSELATRAYDPAQRFWAIEEHSGQLRFLTSSDGASFVTIYEGPAPFDVSVVAPTMYAGTDAAIANPGAARFASFNGGVASGDSACPISTLVDTFDTDDSHLWEGSFADVCCAQQISGGVLTMTRDGTSGYVAHSSSAGYDLREGSIIASIASAPATGSPSFANLLVKLDPMNLIAVQLYDTKVSVYQRIGGTGGSQDFPLNGARYMRIRESGGMVGFDASPDRLAWTELQRVPAPFRLDDVLVLLESGSEIAGAADSISWDDVGLP